MSAEHHPLQEEDLVISEGPTKQNVIGRDYVIEVTPKNDDFWENRPHFTEQNMSVGRDVFLPHNSKNNEK